MDAWKPSMRPLDFRRRALGQDTQSAEPSPWGPAVQRSADDELDVEPIESLTLAAPQQLERFALAEPAEQANFDAGALQNLARWEEKVKSILVRNRRERVARRLPAPTTAHSSHWSEARFTVAHVRADLDCPCQRCLAQELRCASEWAWQHFFADGPHAWHAAAFACDNAFPPGALHPHYDLFLHLRAVLHTHTRSRRTRPRPLARPLALPPAVPNPSRRAGDRSRLKASRGVSLSRYDDGDSSSSSSTDEEAGADQLARVIATRRRAKQREQRRKRKIEAAAPAAGPSRKRRSERVANISSNRNEDGHRAFPRRKMEATTAPQHHMPHELHMHSSPRHTVTPRPHPHPHLDIHTHTLPHLDIHTHTLPHPLPHPPARSHSPPAPQPSPLSSTSTPISTSAIRAPSMNDNPSALLPDVPTTDTRPAAWPETPTADKRIDHALPSNVRDSLAGLQDPLSHFPVQESGIADNAFDSLLSYGENPLPHAMAKQELDVDDFDMKTLSTPSNEAANYAETTTLDDGNDASDDGETNDSLKAYAMLRFPDSYCLITSMNLVIVRDESYRARYLMQKKGEKKRRKAEQALDEYAREPSHPSLRGDDDAPGPSHGPGDDGDLEGRPARGLLSNFSEQGGAVSYPADSDDEADLEAERARRRRRKNKANSSSANSIAPQDLSIFGGNGDEGEYLPTEEVLDENGFVRDPREWAQLPVHTARPEDIGKISREHLIFSYDMNRQRWVLNVTGRGVVVNAVFHPKGCEAIELNHQDEIFVSTVRMIFELPNQQEASDDDDSEDDGLAERYGLLSTSPVRRLSIAVGSYDSEDEEEEPKLRPPKPVKIKLTNKKKEPPKDAAPPGKGKGKGKNKGKTIEQPAKADKADKTKPKADSPEVPKKAEKGKKPKATTADATGDTPVEGNEQPKEESAAAVAAPVIDPNSVLADLAPDQMPEKRKGPGRPPKNGLLSKRDESAIKRKQREYERRGEAIPDLQVLINIVRAEQRAKDIAAKAAARGEAAPDTPIPSIENDGHNESGFGASTVPKDSLGGTSGSPVTGDRTSPKPIRRPKSPSPIKPEAEFTEEELKKPNMTYIYIIDEILQNMEGSQADLQTIYDKIQKRWPYYKYRVNSVGWQSSVRHNLLQCDRFKEAGKSGKGRFWTINFDHPLDNKKKRPSPPPRPPMPPPMANGGMPHGLPHMPPSQYGQPAYAPAYGQPPMNGPANYAQGPQPGSGSYYSPYGGQQNAYGSGPHRTPSAGPYMQNGAHNPPHPAGQQPPQPPRAPAPPPFQRVVDAIMAYRTRFLQSFPPNTPAFAENEKSLTRAIQYYSDRFHGNAGGEGLVTAEEADREPFRTLKAIFDEHQDLTKAANAAPQGQAQQSAPSATANGQYPQPMPQAPTQKQPVPPPTNNSQAGAMPTKTSMANGDNAPPSAMVPVQSTTVPPAPTPASNGNQQPAIIPPGTEQTSSATGNPPTPKQVTPQVQSPIAPQQPKVNDLAEGGPPAQSNSQTLVCDAKLEAENGQSAQPMHAHPAPATNGGVEKAASPTATNGVKRTADESIGNDPEAKRQKTIS